MIKLTLYILPEQILEVCSMVVTCRQNRHHRKQDTKLFVEAGTNPTLSQAPNKKITIPHKQCRYQTVIQIVQSLRKKQNMARKKWQMQHTQSQIVGKKIIGTDAAPQLISYPQQAYMPRPQHAPARRIPMRTTACRSSHLAARRRAVACCAHISQREPW